MNSGKSVDPVYIRNLLTTFFDLRNALNFCNDTLFDDSILIEIPMDGIEMIAPQMLR